MVRSTEQDPRSRETIRRNGIVTSGYDPDYKVSASAEEEDNVAQDTNAIGSGELGFHGGQSRLSPSGLWTV